MEEAQRFVGIDVAKVALDVFMGSAGGAFSVLSLGHCRGSTPTPGRHARINAAIASLSQAPSAKSPIAAI